MVTDLGEYLSGPEGREELRKFYEWGRHRQHITKTRPTRTGGPPQPPVADLHGKNLDLETLMDSGFQIRWAVTYTPRTPDTNT